MTLSMQMLPPNDRGVSGFFGDAVSAIVVQSDGKIVIGGAFLKYNGIDTPDSLIRLNSDGSWDPSFNEPGRGMLDDGIVFSLSQDSAGRLLVGGLFDRYETEGNVSPGAGGIPGARKNLLRLTSNGKVDNSFFPPSPDSIVYAIAQQPNGKILVGGDFAYCDKGIDATGQPFTDVSDRIMRLEPSGKIDTSFNAGGSGADGRVRALAIQSDGKILVGGNFTSYNGDGTAPDSIMRLNADGTRDTTFNPGGSGMGGSLPSVNALALTSDQKALVGGFFTSYNGTDVPFCIIRLARASGKVAFSSATYSVGEAAGNAAIVLKRTGGADTEVVAKVTVANGTTTSADYTFPAGGVTVTWPAGDSTDKVVLVPIVNDGGGNEGDETLTLNLALVSGGAFLDSPNTATLTIQDASDFNGAPSNTVPGPQSTNEDVPLVFSSEKGNQISISDPDAGANPVQVTLIATQGTVTLNGTTGLTFAAFFGDGVDDSSMRFTGTIPDINRALNGMSFKPAAGFHAVASLLIETNDLGNSGVSFLRTVDTDTISITVNAVADTPSVTNATTTVGVQTTSGLVISRNPADGAEVTHFKITSIIGGTLFKNDGTTQINNNDFITFAEGNAGLKFTPNTKTGSSFKVQSSFNNTDAGLGVGFATATITVTCGGSTVVTNSNDDGSGSLRQAIFRACNGAEVTFDMTQVVSPITLTSSELVIGGDLTITGPGADVLTITRNTAAGLSTAGIFYVANGKVKISGLTISNGVGITVGGIYNERGTLTLSRVVVSGNTGNFTGSIFNSADAVLTLDNSIVTGGSGLTIFGGGGAVFNFGTFNATNSSITGNTAKRGGGIFNNGSMTLLNCTVSGNEASNDGGGILNSGGGKLFLLNSTISGNTATTKDGGGIANVGSGQLTLVNSTVSANNSGASGGGIMSTAPATTSLMNTIVTGNTAFGAGPDLGGTFTSQDYNLIGNPAGATLSGTTTHNLTNVNALLGPLANNGGPTKTHALLLGSPAINAGDNCVVLGNCAGNFAQLLRDQRGFARQGTAVDIGAFEANYTIEATAGTPQSVLRNSTFPTILKATVKESGRTLSNISVIFTAPGSGASGTFAGTGTNTATATTDANGVATAPQFGANGIAGGPYNVIASVTGITGTASFALTNLGAPQTMTFGGLANKTFGDADFIVSTTASSSLTVSLAASGNCTVGSQSPGTVHITGTGSCTITASQSGNTNYNAATDVQQSFQIAQAPTATAVTSSVNPSGLGQNVTFTATVTSTAGTPSGTVQFKDGGNNLGSPVAVNASGAATLQINSLTAGNHTITAEYSGDANFSSSTGTLSGGQTVNIETSISINDVSLTEGNTGTKSFDFTVTLSQASNLTVTLEYATTNGTATTSSDYQPTTGQLSFAPGDLTKTVTVQVNGDTQNEPNETFFVNLSNAQNSTLLDNQGLGTIQNDDAPGVQFSSNAYSFSEGAGHGDIIVTRTGDTSQALLVDYQTSDQSGLTPCQTNNTGIASDRCDYATAAGTLRFAAGESQKTIPLILIDDAYMEGAEQLTITLKDAVGGVLSVNNVTLENPMEMALGANDTASITITDNDTQLATQNPIDGLDFFLRQLYLDFLGREPDAAGFQFWKQRMTGQCPSGQQCDRIDTALRFSASDEFKERGYFVYLFYHAALGRRPAYSEWLMDVSKLNGMKTVAEQEAAKDAFIDEFMSRQEFLNLYNGAQIGQAFVDLLIQKSGVTPASKQQLINNYDTVGRAKTLRAFIETQEVQAAFIDRAFVSMLYFGLLRRNAEAGGFSFWMQKLNNSNQDYRLLMGGFLNSDEYWFRFSMISTTP